MSLKDHAHVPFLIILYKALESWRRTSGKTVPSNWREKEELREIIRESKLKNEDGVPEDEENFEEAIKAVNSAVNVTKIPSNVQEILQDSACINLTSKVCKTVRVQC